MQKKDYYSFFNQSKYIAGTRAMDHIPIELHSYDAFRPLVIATKDVTMTGLKNKFIKAFYDSDVTLGGFYDDVADTASIGIIKDLRILYHDRGCDSIIAVGHGPAMDTAKGLNMMISLGVDDIIPLAGVDTIKSPLKPFFAVPTAKSSGYDMSNTAVIENRKFRSDFLFPDVVCLDPKMTAVKDIQKAVESAMIALTHAMEASDSEYHNPMNDAYSLAAIQFIHENLPKIMKCSCDKEAGMALAYANALAAVAFSNAPAGAAQLLGEALARLTGNAPGVCMGILLPHAVAFMIGKKILMRDELLMAQAGLDVHSNTPEKDRIKKSEVLLKQLVGSAGKYIPSSLKELKIPGYTLEEAARQAEAAGAHGLTFKDYMTILAGAGQAAAKR
jgi:alcohol dehydrogenase